MKILITGSVGTGKSNFSRYLHSKNSSFDLIDIEDFNDIHSFENAILNSKNCIVVIQNKLLFTSNINFDFNYFCTRPSENVFSITDGFLCMEFTKRQMSRYFDKRLYSVFK